MASWLHFVASASFGSGRVEGAGAGDDGGTDGHEGGAAAGGAEQAHTAIERRSRVRGFIRLIVASKITPRPYCGLLAEM